jgi:hypothetical protein
MGLTDTTFTDTHVPRPRSFRLFLVHKRPSWVTGQQQQSPDGANGWVAPRPIELVSGSQHFAKFDPTATFQPTECPTAPASNLPHAGQWMVGPHATPGPFVLPSGGPGFKKEVAP